MRGRARTLPSVSLVAVLAVVSACRGSDVPRQDDPSTGAGGDAAERYGLGPTPDPSFTYQPDVVLIEGGPQSIRGVSADGLTWSVDARAGNVERLAPGMVMFATSQAVGRVVRRESRAGVVDITLAPVGLGEVIRDGRIVIDQVVPLDALTIFEAPQIAGGYEDEPSRQLAGWISPPPVFTISPAHATSIPPETSWGLVRAGMARAVPGASAVTSDVSEKTINVSGWALSAYRTTGTVGLRAQHGFAGAKIVEGSELKVALDAHLEVAGLRIVADIPVTRGEVGTSHFRVYGIKGLAMSVQAGAVNGLSDNRKARIEIPVQLRQNVIIGGFPATLTQKFRFLVHTAFTAKNGNLTGSGEWDVDGAIGIDGQTVTLPTVSARGVKVIDSIAGVSVGVNGIVVGVSFEFGLLVGLPIAGAGPTASFITSLGMTNGSSLGIVQCKQVSITSDVSAGVGIQVFDPIKAALKAVLGYDVPPSHTLLRQNVVQEKWVKPNVVACR